MKSKMRKKLIAFMLCMVLVICNSVSLLADAPAAATTTTEKQVKETGTAKSEGESEEEQSADDEKDTSEQSDEESAPETETTEKKEETTEATTEDKEDATTATTTKAKEETTEATETSDKDQTTGAADDSDKKEGTSEISEETTEATGEASTEKAEETTQSPAYDGKYEDSTVTISVSAEAGIVPEGAELSVTPIVKTDITDDMSDEDKVKAEEVNAQYDLTEKKLAEDSEANEETMEGFLAYDISFIVDGEEVEPNGDVKVVMDFKEAAVPEGVSEDATVAVKHLKEDETAEDGLVVEDMAEKATVETTDKAEVEKVEFTADSFSTYTIKWEKQSLEIHVVDSSGNPYPDSNEENGNYNFDGQKVISVNQIANDIREGFSIGSNVKFNKAVIVDEGKDFSFAATQIYGLMYKDNDFWRCTDTNIEGTSGWGAVENSEIYFIFGDDPALTTTPVNTVSTKDTIEINLFDYQVGTTGDESADWYNNFGINNNHVLKFVDSKGSNNHNININQTGSSGHINSGMVQNKLNDAGFPLLSSSKSGGDGSSLDYLFNNNGAANVKRTYTDLDYLFKIDEDGYHVFNSDEDYAYLSSSDGEFSDNFSVVNINGMDSPGFYPFSQPAYDTLTKIKESSEEAVLGYTGVNHYYGMTIETTFIQPKGGQITTTGGTNQNMIFEFSGDDDVWVFIDDVLVLDLGGIHGKVSGTIDFATGNVTRTDINNGDAAGTTIRKAFEDANVEADLKTGTNTFSDYSTHTIKFFYLESKR